jgi:hypothetical protein
MLGGVLEEVLEQNNVQRHERQGYAKSKCERGLVGQKRAERAGQQATLHMRCRGVMPAGGVVASANMQFCRTGMLKQRIGCTAALM